MSTLTRRINTIPAWKMFTYLLLAFGVWLVCYAGWVAWQVHAMHATAQGLLRPHGG